MFSDFFLGGMLVCLAVLIVIPTLCFLLIGLFEGFPKIRLGQIGGIVVVAAFVFALFTVGPDGEVPIMVLGVAVPLIVFFTLWRRELAALMLRRGDEFPDPTDKMVWIVLLTIAAPAGVWLFRAYRKARWPEPVKAGRWAVERSVSWDEVDAPSPEPVGVE
jgi:hypothetical protein